MKKKLPYVRKIYRLYLEGRTPSNIVAILKAERVMSPGGKEKWQVKTIINILTNEKYYGAALLQKSFTIDFLTKKIQQNSGELPCYYIEDDHKPIISRAVFDEVQNLIGQPRCFNASHFPFSNKIICGGVYGRKINGSYSNDKKYRKAVWRCNHRFSDKNSRHALLLNEEAILYAFHLAILEHWKSQPKLHSLCRKTLSSIICSDKQRGQKDKRLQSINSYLSGFCNISPLSLALDDSAWRVIVAQATATLDKTLTLRLIDGSYFEYPILRPHEFKKIKNSQICKPRSML